jgi:TIR domain
MMAAAGEPPLGVFVSYSSKDRLDALMVREILEERGCQVWLDVFDIVGTKALRPQLAEALRGAGVLCLLLSPTAVQSAWVREELRLARENDMRVLPVILRPCEIPEELDGLAGVSALDGIGSNHVRLQLVRAVAGKEAVADAQIDQAYREVLAERAALADATPVLRETARQLAELRQQPIRRLDIDLDASGLPPDGSVLLELVFAVEADNLFTAPLSFFFAAFVEGHTWPPELGFEEPAYSDFRPGQVRIDAWMRWYDRMVRLDQTIDATDTGDQPARFCITFDGADWLPSGPGIHLRRAYELPSLAKLAADGAEFRLAAHYPGPREARWLDPEKTDYGLTVTAQLPNDSSPSRPRFCRLFKTGHDRTELTLLSGDFLSSLATALEREAVLGRYRPLIQAVREGHERRAAEVRRIYQSGELRDDGDRRSSARLAFQEASLHRLRGQAELAGRCLVKVTELLEPLIFEREAPNWADAELLINAYANLRELNLHAGHPANAWACNPHMLSLADTMINAEPNQPDYRRWFARSLQERAQLLLEHGVWQLIESGEIIDPTATMETPAICVREALRIWRMLHEVFGSKATREDLTAALLAASAFASKHGLSDLPAEEWAAEARSLH